MKRSLKGICKFLGLGLLTIITTVIIFKQLRPPRDSTSFNRAINPLPPPEELVQNSMNDFGLDSNVLDRLDIKSKEKIDWHNYAQIEEEMSRTGKVTKH